MTEVQVFDGDGITPLERAASQLTTMQFIKLCMIAEAGKSGSMWKGSGSMDISDFPPEIIDLFKKGRCDSDICG